MPKKSAIPATPLYSMMIRTDQDGGLALDIDGQALAADPDIATLRAKGLAELRIRAALAGRPVRARAVEPTAPTPWLMIVSPDGTVTDVAEHPAPPQRPAAEHKGPSVSPPAEPAAPEPAGLPVLPAVPPVAPVPEHHREAWARLRAAYDAGDLPTAVVCVLKLETALEAEYGPLDPHTVNALTIRAWLTLYQRTDLDGTVELLIATVLRRQAAKVRPKADTARAARNAHAVWLRLMDEDPQAALTVAPSLADMLAIRGWDNHRRDVLARTEAAAALAV
ncbi:hypothetical protein [Streptomyces sp. NPDC059957]|uniref:hypothetical protein n=1 Tax=unclassified Streptomyces TaxID=2593676 RepID=UPI003661DCF2